MILRESFLSEGYEIEQVNETMILNEVNLKYLSSVVIGDM
jgi:hypothetical protein